MCFSKRSSQDLRNTGSSPPSSSCYRSIERRLIRYQGQKYQDWGRRKERSISWGTLLINLNIPIRPCLLPSILYQHPLCQAPKLHSPFSLRTPILTMHSAETSFLVGLEGTEVTTETKPDLELPEKEYGSSLKSLKNSPSPRTNSISIKASSLVSSLEMEFLLQTSGTWSLFAEVKKPAVLLYSKRQTA